MTKSSGIADRLYSHGNDLSGDVNSVGNISSSVNLLSFTTIPDASEVRTQGLSDGAIDFDVWFDDEALAAHPVLSALPTTNVLLLYLRGATLGNPCAALTALMVDYPGTRAADGSLSFSVTTQGAAGAPTEWGEMLTAGTVTHSSNGESETGTVDSQTTLGGVGFLQGISAATGTATVLIEDSSDTSDGDDGSWSTLLTFANTSSTWPIGERLTVTGTVEKGLRATTTGTFTTAKFVVGFKRGLANDRVDLS